MSRGSSTTQTTVASRRSSEQIEHCGPSEMLKQRVQKVMRSFTSVMERARRTASSFGSFRRWNAMRCADFGPTPGRRPSSSIRSWTGPAYKPLLRGSGAVGASTAEQAAEAATHAEAAHGLLVDVVDLGQSIVQGGEDEIFQHADVVGIDGPRVDGDPLELHAAVRGDLHHPAAGSAFHDLLGRGRLRLHQLRLHLLSLLEEGGQVDGLLVTHAVGCFRALGAAGSRDLLGSRKRLPHSVLRRGYLPLIVLQRIQL